MRNARWWLRALAGAFVVLAAGCGGGGSSSSSDVPMTRQVSVAKAGSGNGSVVSTPAGVNCGGSCSAAFGDGTVVELNATAAAGSVFAGWSGACSGSATQVSVTLDAAKSCTADFTALRALGVSLVGAGSGTVSSGPAGIACGATCSAQFADGTSVTLTATPAPGTAFVQWGGDCAGTSAAASITLTAARSCTAQFEPAHALSVTKAGTGTGSVTSSLAGIDCGASCNAVFLAGTSVTLTAAASSGSVFAGWGGACSASAASATVAIVAALNCTANFNPAPGPTLHTLTVSKTGTGSGTVASTPGGVDCGATCSASYGEGRSVTLAATAGTGATFAGWSGDCTGAGPTASTTLIGSRSCTASLAPASTGDIPSLSYEGYHLVALAGTGAATPAKIQFANGVTEKTSPDALYAVNVLTGIGHQIGAAGEWHQLELGISTLAPFNRVNSGANQFESAHEPSTGLIRDYRVRISTFARGGRLYKVNHVSTAEPPVPQLWSSVRTEEICRTTLGLSVATSDIADIADHWVFKSAGADGGCGSTATYRAIPFSAGPTDDAVAIEGTPLAALHDRAKRRTGYILSISGGQFRVNADFSSPTALPPLGSPLALMGRQTPRYLLVTGGFPTRIYAYDLINGGARVEVASVATGEFAPTPLDVVTEDGTAYVRLTNLVSRTVRVLRIDDTLSTQVLATVSPGSLIAPLESGLPMRTTSNRVVLAVGGGLYSIPKSGGSPLLISSAAVPMIFGFITAGGNVWYPSAYNVAISSKLGVVREDGTNPATIDLALSAGSPLDFMRPLLPTACTHECRHAALTLNVGAPSATNAGSVIATYDGVTRALIATHGNFPSSPPVAFGTLVSTPLQLGQQGLANFNSIAGFDLFLFKTSQAGFSRVPLD